MESGAGKSRLSRVFRYLALAGFAIAGGSGCTAPRTSCHDTFSWIAAVPCSRSGPEKEYKTNTAAQINLLKSEAAAGDPVAALHLGTHFAARESSEAWKWYCLAANQGEVWSQVEMGDWHRLRVPGTPSREDFLSTISPDPRIAYMWYSLAGKGGNRAGAIYPKELSKKLSKDQLSEADQMVRDWKPGDCPSAEHRLGVPGET